MAPPNLILKKGIFCAHETHITNDLLRISLMNEIFKNQNIPFLRIELGGAVEVSYRQGLAILLILEGVESRTIISRLNFRIFEFSHRALAF